jgi:CHAT domain-containing protein
MNRRLYKDADHPDLANSLNNLAVLYRDLGKLAAAEPLYKDALNMNRRLYQGRDHRTVAASLIALAFLHRSQGKSQLAEPLFKESLAMFRRLTLAYSQARTEGETLTLAAAQPLARDAFISSCRDRPVNAADVYAQVWADKGAVARAYERRLLQARAAATDPRAAQTLGALTDARRRRAELLLAESSNDPATSSRRDAEIARLDDLIAKQSRDLKEMLPASGRSEKLDAAAPADLQKVLPADAAVVDFLRFVQFDRNKDGPGDAQTPRYAAFVLTNEQLSWVDLEDAETIEPAAEAWRTALASGKAVPADQAARVRRLVWEKVRKQLPPSVKTVYVCPDAELCKLPFAALPGDKPGTVLLEDFALAMIPHATFLLDQLWPHDERKKQPAHALVVGGVNYDVEVSPRGLAPVAGRGEPLMKPGQKIGWSFLSYTVGEADGVVAAAGRKKIPAVKIEGEKATAAAVLEALPNARYAHFATHGFFADPTFRFVFKLHDKDFENLRGERVGKAALSPLVMTGLVLAGANSEQTPGRGIVTGEHLIDLDLDGLELAVLSACETGLGDVAGGQGTFGLQRAFHYAGTTNVVCSLWKVPDESTAALMKLFYTNVWDKNLSPMESLRQAQLEIYRNPGRIGEWAKQFRGNFERVPGAGGETETKPTKDGRAHPVYWAAFTISGPGR